MRQRNRHPLLRELRHAVECEGREGEAPDGELRQRHERDADELAHHQRKRANRGEQNLRDARLLLLYDRAEDDLAVHENGQVDDEADAEDEVEALPRVLRLLAPLADLSRLHLHGLRYLAHVRGVDVALDHALLAHGLRESVCDLAVGEHVARVARVELRRARRQNVRRDDEVAVKLVPLHTLVETALHLFDVAPACLDHLDRVPLLARRRRALHAVAPVLIDCARGLSFGALLVLVAPAQQRLAHALVHAPRLVNDGDACGAARLYARDERGDDREDREHQGRADGDYEKHPAPDALHVLALDDREELPHSSPPTNCMKMSFRLGSTNSNFVT